MNHIRDTADGQTVRALICFTDINGFTNISRSAGIGEALRILRETAEISSAEIQVTSGCIVKYIGDSSLIVFPEEDTDQGVQTLLKLKSRLDETLKRRGLAQHVGFSLHCGELYVMRLPPFNTFDVMGDAVNTAATLDRGRNRGKLIISPQVFRKLKPETRKGFHKFTPPVIYISD
jgi:class 3 adenylate cyclase